MGKTIKSLAGVMLKPHIRHSTFGRTEEETDGWTQATIPLQPQDGGVKTMDPYIGPTTHRFLADHLDVLWRCVCKLNQFSPFRYFPVFQNDQMLVTYWISYSYLTGVSASEPRRHFYNYEHDLRDLTCTFAKLQYPITQKWTHLPLDKMAAISQTIFWNAFSWMKSFAFG